MNSTDSCVEGIGHRHRQGYVQVGHDGEYAHRLAWEQEHGQIPAGLHVLHRCDNPSCVNVDHLFLGTHADNMRDMVLKGRVRPKGEPPKLDEAAVIDIRRGGSARTLAAKYGVSVWTIYDVRSRRSWRHV